MFPKHSPLLPDVSQAILNVTEGEKMMSIESKWFKKESNCQSSSKLGSSNSLGLESFWGLFLIAGLASIFALIIFVASFIFQNKHRLMDRDSEASTSERVRLLFKIFNQKDLNSRTFIKSSQPGDLIPDVRDEVNVSPNNNWAESPFSHTSHRDSDSEQKTPITGQPNILDISSNT